MADFDLRPMFQTPDGKSFETKAEAMDHMRRPVIEKALNEVVEDNAELVTWLLDNRDTIASAFETGTIKRVTKSERGKLEKALKAIVEANDPKFAFVADNHEAIAETFRWPSVKRLKDDEKEAAVKEALTELADGNEEVADFIINSKEELLGAFDAGKVKREINPKAREGLARYQAEKAAEKAAAAQAEAKTPAKKK